MVFDFGFYPAMAYLDISHHLFLKHAAAMDVSRCRPLMLKYQYTLFVQPTSTNFLPLITAVYHETHH